MYQQLGANLAAARRAIEELQGEDAHKPESGGSLGEDMWTAGVSSMTELWAKHNPQEVVPGGTAFNTSYKNLRKQFAAVKTTYENAYAER